MGPFVSCHFATKAAFGARSVKSGWVSGSLLSTWFGVPLFFCHIYLLFLPHLSSLSHPLPKEPLLRKSMEILILQNCPGRAALKPYAPPAKWAYHTIQLLPAKYLQHTHIFLADWHLSEDCFIALNHFSTTGEERKEPQREGLWEGTFH